MDETLFAGTPRPQQDMASVARGFAKYQSVDADASPVRHLTGYASFVVFLRASGLDAAAIAADIPKLIDVVLAHAPALSSDAELRAAAAVFLGNALVAVNPSAEWRMVGAREVRGNTQSVPVDRVIELWPTDPEAARAAIVEFMPHWLADAEFDPDAWALQPSRTLAAPPAIRYARPAIDQREFRDEHGTVIPYGEGWDDGPPDDAYSVVSNPERYEPLHTVADALLEYLLRTYDVSIDRDDSCRDDLMAADGVTIQRIARITPGDPACAALTIAWTDFPGVIVHAGVLQDFVNPHCGCDACDQPVADALDELERVVFAVVEGRFREQVGFGAQTIVAYAISEDGASSTGMGRSFDPPSDRERAAADRLAALPDGWQPWPLRASVS